MHINEDLFAELAEAVFAGDIAKAETVLRELQMVGSDCLSEAVRRARRRAQPDLAVSVVPPATPEVFPKPGHLPGSTLARPVLVRDGATV